MTARRFTGVVCASFMVAAALRFGTHRHRILVSQHLRAMDVQREILKKSRKIYSYSVIPGGAYSREELALALNVDPVAAAHYSDFEAARASVLPLPKDAYLYVSYRKADHVYWTANKRRIPKGEMVLSDGKHLARTRCGNRLSSVPEFPIAHGPQPTELALNAPELPSGIELPQAPLLAPEYDAPVMPLADTLPREFSLPVGTSGVSGIAQAFPALAFPSPYMALAGLPVANQATSGQTPTTPATPSPPGSIPGGVVPEPGSGALLGLGGALTIFLAAGLRRRVH